MPCSIRTLVALALALAACGSDTAGDELPDGAFTSGPGGETSPTEASADDDPSVTVTNTTPADTTNGDETTSSSSGATTTGSETTSPITADTSTTESTDPSTTESTSESTTESTDPSTTETTDPSTDTGPLPQCGDGDPVVGEVCLQPAQPYAMGLAPSGVVLGDFDGNGDLDVATSNEDGDDVSVRLGNGDGTFAAETNYGVGTQPVALGVGRFDAGTDDDLVVVNRGSNDISILLADGAGGFAPATTELVGTTPVDVGVGRIDAGAIDDVVVLNQADDDYTVLISNGDGTFTPHGPFATGVATPNTIVTQSFNSMTDQALDVFALGGTEYFGSPGDNTGEINVAFEVMATIAGANIVRASPAQIDAGTTWDIALVENLGDRVVFLMGNGTAMNFPQIAADVDPDPSDVVAIDVDGDVIRDAVVAQRSTNSIAIVPFSGVAFDAPVEFTAGTAPSAIAAADLNGDMIPDVVVANGDGDDISVLLSDP